MSGAVSQPVQQPYGSFQPMAMFDAFRSGASWDRINAMNPATPRSPQFLPPALPTTPMQNSYGDQGLMGRTAFGQADSFASGPTGMDTGDMGVGAGYGHGNTFGDNAVFGEGGSGGGSK